MFGILNRRLAFGFFLMLINSSICLAQSDFGDTDQGLPSCGPTSLQSLMAAYEFYVIDQSADNDSDDVSESELSPYERIGGGFQKLLRSGFLGNTKKMPETLLGESEDAHVEWSELFSDSNASIDDTMLEIFFDDDLQATFDNASCRDIGDICRSIAGLKAKTLKAPALRLLKQFLASDLLRAYQSTQEVDDSEILPAINECKAASKNLDALIRGAKK